MIAAPATVIQFVIAGQWACREIRRHRGRVSYNRM
jgi:hypothetical protein